MATQEVDFSVGPLQDVFLTDEHTDITFSTDEVGTLNLGQFNPRVLRVFNGITPIEIEITDIPMVYLGVIEVDDTTGILERSYLVQGSTMSYLGLNGDPVVDGTHLNLSSAEGFTLGTATVYKMAFIDSIDGEEYGTPPAVYLPTHYFRLLSCAIPDADGVEGTSVEYDKLALYDNADRSYGV